MDLTPGIKELHIISYHVTGTEMLVGYLITTSILIGLGIYAYDRWMNRFGKK